MNMNFESIKAGFLSYLSEKQGGTDETENLTYSSSVSIFMYSSEFKDYLVEEAGADSSIFSKSINEIMQMDIVNGKLVEETEESDSDSFESESEDSSDFMTDVLNEALSDENVISTFDSDKSGDLNEDEINLFLSGLNSDENGEISFDSLAETVTDIQNGTYNTENLEDTGINDLLNKVYENKTVIKTLDLDGNGELSAEEKTQFEEFINGYDGDDSSLSEFDIRKAMTDIIDGTFSYETETEDISNQETTVETEDVDNTEASTGSDTDVSSTQGTSGTGSTGTSGISSSSSARSTSTANDDSLESKSLSELESIRTEREEDVTTAQENVNAVYSGENAAVSAAQEDYEDAREAYDEAVENDKNISDDLKERRETNLNDIEEKESAIDSLNISINEKDEEISQQESTISEEESTLSGYKTSLSKLQSQTTDDSEKQAEIDQAISDVKAAIEALEAQIDEDNEYLEKLNTQKTELEGQLDEAEEELSELETTRAEIEEEILANCSDETKAALAAYNEAKDNVASVKESELKTAKSDLTEAQAALDEVNEVINTKKEEEAQKEYSVSSGTLPEDLFKGALEGQEDLVAEIAEEYGIEPEFFAAIICLESAYGSSNLAEKYNNFGGVTGSGDAGSINTSTGYTFACYSSVEEGLEAMAKNLAAYSSRYSDVNAVDIDNVSAIGNHYCVGGDWANKVSNLYNKIKNMES